MTEQLLIFQRLQSSEWVSENFSDGSVVLLENTTKTIHSLDATAAAALASCGDPAGLSDVVLAMQSSLKRPVTESEALAALEQLQHAGLVTCRNADDGGVRSRRDLLRAMGTAAGASAPMVLSLTVAEQKVYAQGVGSGIRIVSASPNSFIPCIGAQTVTLTGVGTHFTNSSVVTFDRPGVTASGVTALSPTSLRATLSFSVPGGITVGVTVTTGAEVATGPGLISVSRFMDCE
jgi:hypothetical protein